MLFTCCLQLPLHSQCLPPVLPLFHLNYIPTWPTFFLLCVNRFFVKGGTPTFIVLAKASSFCQQFLTGRKVKWPWSRQTSNPGLGGPLTTLSGLCSLSLNDLNRSNVKQKNREAGMCLRKEEETLWTAEISRNFNSQKKRKTSIGNTDGLYFPVLKDLAFILCKCALCDVTMSTLQLNKLFMLLAHQRLWMNKTISIQVSWITDLLYVDVWKIPASVWIMNFKSYKLEATQSKLCIKQTK